MRQGLLFVLLVVACKSDEGAETKPLPPIPAPATFVSGSRLRAMFQEADGVRLFGSWQDTKLGALCSFASERCLTNDVRVQHTDLATFDDPACTMEIVSSPGPARAILIRDPSQLCSSGTLHTAGDRITPALLYRKDANGACIAIGESGAQGGEYVRVGPEVTPETDPFVHAREENEASSARVVLRWRIADDGAREIVGAWDNERNELVTRPSDTSGKRWYPAKRAALVGEGCPGIATSYECEPKVAISSPGACRPPEIYQLGPPAGPTSCRAGTFGSYEVLGSIPTQTFAEATTVFAGTGRVRLKMDARADGTPLIARELFDSEAGLPCGAAFIDEGTARCRPSSDSRASEAYADAACTELAIAWNPAVGACDADPEMPRRLGLPRDGQEAIVVDVGERISGAFRKVGGGCTPFDPSAAAEFHRVSPTDESALSVLTFRTE